MLRTQYVLLLLLFMAVLTKPAQAINRNFIHYCSDALLERYRNTSKEKFEKFLLEYPEHVTYRSILEKFRDWESHHSGSYGANPTYTWSAHYIHGSWEMSFTLSNLWSKEPGLSINLLVENINDPAIQRAQKFLSETLNQVKKEFKLSDNEAQILRRSHGVIEHTPATKEHPNGDPSKAHNVMSWWLSKPETNRPTHLDPRDPRTIHIAARFSELLLGRIASWEGN